MALQQLIFVEFVLEELPKLKQIIQRIVKVFVMVMLSLMTVGFVMGILLVYLVVGW